MYSFTYIHFTNLSSTLYTRLQLSGIVQRERDDNGNKLGQQFLLPPTLPYMDTVNISFP